MTVIRPIETNTTTKTFCSHIYCMPFFFFRHIFVSFVAIVFCLLLHSMRFFPLYFHVACHFCFFLRLFQYSDSSDRVFWWTRVYDFCVIQRTSQIVSIYLAVGKMGYIFYAQEMSSLYSDYDCLWHLLIRTWSHWHRFPVWVFFFWFILPLISSFSTYILFLCEYFMFTPINSSFRSVMLIMETCVWFAFSVFYYFVAV